VRILDTLRARDPRAAARSAVLILAVCTGVLTGLNTFHDLPPWTFAWVASWLGVLVLAPWRPAPAC
jgi:hypothetical protein